MEISDWLPHRTDRVPGPKKISNADSFGGIIWGGPLAGGRGEQSEGMEWRPGLRALPPVSWQGSRTRLAALDLRGDESESARILRTLVRVRRVDPLFGPGLSLSCVRKKRGRGWLPA